MSKYILSEQGQIISPLGQVVADVHGLATSRGRNDAELMVRALNSEPERQLRLRMLKRDAEHLATSGRPTEHEFRALAQIVEALVAEGAR